MKIRKGFMYRIFLFFFCFFLSCLPLFAQKTETVYFESRDQQLDTVNKTFRMEGDAVLRNDSMEIHASRITIQFSSGEKGKNFSGQRVESLRAGGNVRIIREDLLSEGTEALYTSAKGSILVKGAPAKVTGTDYQVTGAEILYGQKTEEMDVIGSKANPSYFYHANDGDPMTIHCDRQEWRMAKNEVLFTGNVRAETEIRTLESEKLLVNYRRIGGKGGVKTAEAGKGEIAVDTVTAMGKVHIRDAQGTGIGDKAVFTGNNDTVILTGNPAEVTHKGNIARGPQIRMNQKTGEMEITGGASGRMIPQDKK